MQPRRTGFVVWYDRALRATAALACLLIGLILTLTVVDASLRYFSIRTHPWFGTVSEYAMLYLTLLASPWLLREKGHIMVDAFRQQLPPGFRRLFEVIVYIVGIAVCLTLAWFGAQLVLKSIALNQLDIRTFPMPRWLLYLPMPVGLLFLAIEFARFLFGRDSLYERTARQKESI